MTRPEDIPEELWEARSTLDIACLPVGGRELVCRAIMAERERCAKIADLYAVGLPGAADKSPTYKLVHETVVGCATNIAVSIRAGHPA